MREHGTSQNFRAFVAQILGVVDGACENALTWALNDSLAEWRPKSIGRPTHERLDAGDGGTREAFEFGNLHNPNPTNLQRGIFAGKRFERGRLLDSLRAFQDQAAIGFDAGLYMRAVAESIQRAAIARL